MRTAPPSVAELLLDRGPAPRPRRAVKRHRLGAAAAAGCGARRRAPARSRAGRRAARSGRRGGCRDSATAARRAGRRAAGDSRPGCRRAPGTGGRAAASTSPSASAGRSPSTASAGSAARSPTAWSGRGRTRVAMRWRSSGSFSFEFSGVTFSGRLPSLRIQSAGSSKAGMTISGSTPSSSAMPRQQLLGLGRAGLGVLRPPRRQVGVVPDRLAVAPPVEREGPARQRLARIPLALAVVQEAARREAVAQAADQLVGQPALGRADRVGVPLVGLEIVDRDEGRLAAHGQAHVARARAPRRPCARARRAPARLRRRTAW